MTRSTDGAPELDWVFCFTPLLGGVCQSWYSARLRDQSLASSGSVSASGGIRWRAEHVPGTSSLPSEISATEISVADELGHLGWGFAVPSRIAVVPEGRLAQDVAWLAYHFDDPATNEGVVEWSLTLVSEAGRVREAVRIVGPGAMEMIELLRRDIGVDYWLSLGGVPGSAGQGEPTSVSLHVRGLSRRHQQQRGHLSLGTESVPEAFTVLGERFGNGNRLAQDAGIVVTDRLAGETHLEGGEPNG